MDKILISANNLDRIFKCPASKKYHKAPSNRASEEGLAAHRAYAQAINAHIEGRDAAEVEDHELQDCLSDAMEHLIYLGLRKASTSEALSINFKTDHSEIQLQGTPDLLYMDSEDRLVIEDFNYGWSVVEPDSNKLKAFAYILNWDKLLREKYQHKSIRLAVRQPRPFHPDGKYRFYDVEDIDALGKDFLAELIKQTSEGYFNPSQECKSCPVMSTCGAVHKKIYDVKDIGFDAYNDVPPEFLAQYLDEITEFGKVVELLKDDLKERVKDSLRLGNPVGNYRLVNRPKREWSPHVTPQVLKLFGDIEPTETKMLSVYKYEKQLRGYVKKCFQENKACLFETVSGADTLVRDKNVNEKIQNIFNKKLGGV